MNLTNKAIEILILFNMLFDCNSLFFRRPNSGEAGKKPSRPSSAAQEKPANEKKKEPDARERRRKEMMQNQVHVHHIFHHSVN